MAISLFITLSMAFVACNAQENRTYRTVCYVEGWTHWRDEPNKFETNDIDSNLCTHVVWNHGELNSTLNIVVHDNGDEDIYRSLTGLKSDAPELKVLLDIGGWPVGSEEFTKIVATPAARQAFADEAVAYLRRFNFDGTVIDWQYPVTRSPSVPADKHRLTELLETMMETFEAEVTGSTTPRLLLVAGITANSWQIGQSFEVTEMAKTVDWLDVRAFDLHGPWEGALRHHSTLFSPTADTSDSIDHMIQLIVNDNVPKEKIDLGIPLFGHTLTLTDPTNTDLGAPIANSQETVNYYEICQLLSGNVTTGRLGSTKAPYVVDGSKWTGYDDAMSIQEKVEYVMENGLGGVSVFSIDMDDFNGLCGEKNPLLNTIHNSLNGLVG